MAFDGKMVDISKDLLKKVMFIELKFNFLNKGIISNTLDHIYVHL